MSSQERIETFSSILMGFIKQNLSCVLIKNDIIIDSVYGEVATRMHC